MYKFFVEDNQITDDRVKIVGTDVNHIINVLRLKQDDEIQICNTKTSTSYIAIIDKYDKETVFAEIIKEMEYSTETWFEIDLYQGLPKADKMETIIQKTTELGVKRIIPVSMERCIVKIDSKDIKRKTERWQKIAEVAAKQSKRDAIPQVENVIKINELYEIINAYDLFIVAYEEEKDSKLKGVLKENKDLKRIGVLIGPEGGIDIKEIERLKEEKVRIVTLGNRILRTETAPIALISNIVYELEN